MKLPKGQDASGYERPSEDLYTRVPDVAAERSRLIAPVPDVGCSRAMESATEPQPRPPPTPTPPATG